MMHTTIASAGISSMAADASGSGPPTPAFLPASDGDSV